MREADRAAIRHDLAVAHKALERAGRRLQRVSDSYADKRPALDMDEEFDRAANFCSGARAHTRWAGQALAKAEEVTDKGADR
jgi:hypothetical protein